MKVRSASWQSLLYDKGEFFIVFGPESGNLIHKISVSVFNTSFLAVVVGLGQQGWGYQGGHCARISYKGRLCPEELTAR